MGTTFSHSLSSDFDCHAGKKKNRFVKRYLFLERFLHGQVEIKTDHFVSSSDRKISKYNTALHVPLTVKDQLVYMCSSAIFSLASSGLAITLKVDEDGKTTSIMQKFSSDEHESYRTHTYTRRALDH